MTDVPTTIKTDLSWLKTHVILVIIVVVLSIGGVYAVESIIAKHDAENDAKWKTILQAQTAQTQLIQDKLTADEKNWTQANAQQETVITNLATLISQRDKTTTVQVQKDATLSASEAAQKITQQTKAQPGEISAQQDNVVLDLSVSRTVAAGLDQLPTVQADLSDTKKQLISETTIADNLQQNVNEQQSLIDSMKKESDAADKSCKASITLVKAQARKSKIKWFFIGVVVGIIGGHYI